jgi:hypothetical protein
MYYDIRSLCRDAQTKYCEHRYSAHRRGIPFLFTFREWWRLWLNSGHWEERGHGRKQYCMARFKDLGAYEVGNVKICTHGENWADFTPERLSAKNRKGAQTRLKTETPEQRSARSKKAAQTRLKNGTYFVAR